jgi:hypothetical protein
LRGLAPKEPFEPVQARFQVGNLRSLLLDDRLLGLQFPVQTLDGG